MRFYDICFKIFTTTSIISIIYMSLSIELIFFLKTGHIFLLLHMTFFVLDSGHVNITSLGSLGATFYCISLECQLLFWHIVKWLSDQFEPFEDNFQALLWWFQSNLYSSVESPSVTRYGYSEVLPSTLCILRTLHSG